MIPGTPRLTDRVNKLGTRNEVHMLVNRLSVLFLVLTSLLLTSLVLAGTSSGTARLTFWTSPKAGVGGPGFPPCC